MRKHRTNKKNIPFHLISEQSTIITEVDKETETASKKISLITIILLCIALSFMTGCANYGSAKIDQQDITPVEPVFLVSKPGNQCEQLNKEIADILGFAKKYRHSQHAGKYLAMTREKLFKMEPRAKTANCTFTSKPADTKLRNLSSL